MFLKQEEMTRKLNNLIVELWDSHIWIEFSPTRDTIMFSLFLDFYLEVQRHQQDVRKCFIFRK